ncbi:MAG: hypothetical protein ACI85U_003361, partial [Candidatus Promineifilaceae bacterium]
FLNSSIFFSWSAGQLVSNATLLGMAILAEMLIG